MIDYLVLETNSLAGATVDSINIHDVGASIKVVEPGDSFIGTAVKTLSNFGFEKQVLNRVVATIYQQ